MKKYLILLVALAVAIGINTHILGSGKKEVPGASHSLPTPDGVQFWGYITETNPYQGWGFWPGHYGMYPGKSPHGAFLKVFANGVALKAAREGKNMPYGAILVKENYGKDKKTLMAVTPMYKVKGYNPEGGDWFWAKYGPDGKIMKAGKVKGCINCHSVQKEKDWIFTEAK